MITDHIARTGRVRRFVGLAPGGGRLGTKYGCDERRGGGRRGKVKGWSVASARRNSEFLRSVDFDRMPLRGAWSLTLTMRDCPEPGVWRERMGRMRDWMRKRFHRGEGRSASHGVVEMTKRGVPHLHMSLFGMFWLDLVQYWLKMWEDHGAGWEGQHTAPMTSARGWSEYCAKHAARGLRHYQRDPELWPESWKKGGAGRMWFALGDWEVKGWDGFRVSDRDWYQLRRRVRRYMGHRYAKAGRRHGLSWGGGVGIARGFEAVWVGNTVGGSGLRSPPEGVEALVCLI